MPDYKYLIVGGGMTAASAVKGIREVDAAGSIGMIGSEEHPPYDRPPLSKGLWKGTPLEKVWREIPSGNLQIHPGKSGKSIDPVKKVVIDAEGTTYQYDRLLLSTGGTVRKFPWKTEGIIYFRTVDDYRKLREATEAGKAFAVIGGGFIGSEIAAALALTGKSVTMIFPDSGIGAKIYPPELSRFLNTFYQSKGVEIVPNEAVTGIETHGNSYSIMTKGGRQFKADGVVAGIGIEPNVALGQSAGLKIDNGIVVDEYTATSRPAIYAAGDVANFYNPALGKRMRVEHEDNANTMGAIAGKNMAGDRQPYHHLPFFYSDLFELGYEAVGETDARMEMVEEWKEPYREGVVYYMGGGRVRGVLLWNTWGQVDHARSLIAEKGPFTPASVRGRLPA
jgi:3-phenylpropionate/trans-cinnamate dioxygenase ferredoxin reductase component